MTYRKRQKASDVFRETDFLFGKTTSFSKAFPEILDISVKVLEDAYGMGVVRREEKYRWRYYSKSNPPGEFTDCSNPLCYNGGVAIGSIIRNMTFSRQTEYEETRMCQGHEGSPKGRKRYGPCDNSFRVKIALTYKDESSD